MLRPQLTSQYCSPGAGGLTLNIINEFDLVSRLDRPYVRCLVDLYRSIYNLPPIQEDDSPVTGIDVGTNTLSDETPNGQTAAQGAHNGKYWRVPEPEYWHIGERVVLKRSVVTRHDSSNYGNDDLKEELALSAVRVAAGEFAKLLFCRVTVHSRVHYKERVEELAEGRFNGRNSWSFEPSEISEAT